MKKLSVFGFTKVLFKNPNTGIRFATEHYEDNSPVKYDDWFLFKLVKWDSGYVLVMTVAGDEENNDLLRASFVDMSEPFSSMMESITCYLRLMLGERVDTVYYDEDFAI